MQLLEEQFYIVRKSFLLQYQALLFTYVKSKSPVRRANSTIRKKQFYNYMALILQFLGSLKWIRICHVNTFVYRNNSFCSIFVIHTSSILNLCPPEDDALCFVYSIYLGFNVVFVINFFNFLPKIFSLEEPNLSIIIWNVQSPNSWSMNVTISLRQNYLHFYWKLLFYRKNFRVENSEILSWQIVWLLIMFLPIKLFSFQPNLTEIWSILFTFCNPWFF